jgi:hypothetical protein
VPGANSRLPHPQRCPDPVALSRLDAGLIGVLRPAGNDLPDFSQDLSRYVFTALLGRAS